MSELPVAAPAIAEVATVAAEVAIEGLLRGPILTLQPYFSRSVSSIFDTLASSRG